LNARAQNLEAPAEPLRARAEHISIEATPETGTPLRHPHRRTLSKFTLSSKLRRVSTELAILQDHYLSVRQQRGADEPQKYVLDLRFVNARPVRVRRIAWVCLGVTIALLMATAGALLWAKFSSDAIWTHPGFFVAITGILASAAAATLFLRRTTESLEFKSVHGAATLISIVGGIGAAKSGKTFLVDLIKNINAAKQARPQPLAHFLRDEMREHHRLREGNVLSQEEYDASKARILSQHR
jgi:hypothetical protein